jgi:hypothetical protein
MPDIGELDRAFDFSDTRAHHRGEVRLPQEDEIADVQIGADQQGESKGSDRSDHPHADPHLALVLCERSG